MSLVQLIDEFMFEFRASRSRYLASKIIGMVTDEEIRSHVFSIFFKSAQTHLSITDVISLLKRGAEIGPVLSRNINNVVMIKILTKLFPTKLDVNALVSAETNFATIKYLLSLGLCPSREQLGTLMASKDVQLCRFLIDKYREECIDIGMSLGYLDRVLGRGILREKYRGNDQDLTEPLTKIGLGKDSIKTIIKYI